MVAALSAFDLPFLRPAQDAFWRALHPCLVAQGFEDPPAKLTRPIDERRLWTHPGLLIGQVDAFRYAQVFYSNLVPVAAPHYDTDRCSGPNYRALVLVREDDPVQAWTDLQQKILAVDGLDLLGSWRLFKAFVAGVTDPAAFFGRVIISGGALETLTLVRSGATDYAVLDCVTAALIRDTEPAHLDGIRILAETDQGLAPPFVTAASRSAGERDRLLAALVAAFSDPGLDEILERLRLRSIEPADPIAYAFEPRPVESTVTLLSTARSQRES